MYRIVFYVIVNLSIIACCCAVNITTDQMSSRMIPNYNMPTFGAAAPPIPKFPLPNPYSIRYMPNKPMDPILFAPHLMNGIVPMALSFSIGYFLLRLLTLGVFFVEKELAFPYGHYRMDHDKMIDQNLWKRSDSMALSLQQLHKAMDKYNHQTVKHV